MSILEVGSKPASPLDGGASSLDENEDPTLDVKLADQAAEEVFGSEDNARATAGLITRFVASWERQKNEKSLEIWLADELGQFPKLWAGEKEIQSAVREIIRNVEQANTDKESLHAHLKNRKSKASWLAGAIERGAAAAGTANVAAYAAGIDTAMQNANAEMLEVISTQGGAISKNPNLDGLIFEQHHVGTFNLQAAAQGSALRAEAPRSHSKNSVDIVIRDGDKPIRRRYQAKCGKDAEATQALFNRSNYRGQRKLVPSGQQDEIPSSTDFIEMDGVRSRGLTKEQAEKLQDQAQQDGKILQHEWNDVSRIEIAKQVGKQAALGAAIACGFVGARVLGRRVWNFLCGKQNPSPSKDLEEFFESSLESGTHAAVQTVVSGATVVAARNGWIKALQNTPAGKIASMVYLGMENTKVLYKFAKGELNGEQALDAMGNTTFSALTGLSGAAAGTKLGSVIGSAFGPVGTVVGGLVGGVAGGMAGSNIGEAVWKGRKRIVKTAAKAVRGVYEGVKRALKAAGSAPNPFHSSSWA